MRSKWAVQVELVISIVVEAESSDHAADIVAGFDFPLGEQIRQKIEDGNYLVCEIETEGEVP
jgi:hypothetical protein